MPKGFRKERYPSLLSMRHGSDIGTAVVIVGLSIKNEGSLINSLALLLFRPPGRAWE
jgi:hypothetical protein